MIQGDIIVIFVCAVCGRGMTKADYIDFYFGLEYCNEHKPAPHIPNAGEGD